MLILGLGGNAMGRMGLAMVGLTSWCCIAWGGETSGKKDPVPTALAQQKALKLVHELYKDDIAKAANDGAAKGRLAATFLQEARDTNDDSAARYVLLDLAGLYASEAGDAPTALQAVEELNAHYQVPAAQIIKTKIDALKIASTSAASPDAYQTVIDISLNLLDDTLAEDDYASSLLLVGAAANAAKKLQNVSLYSSIVKKREEVQRQEGEFAKWKPFADRLKKDVGDAEALTQLGTYYALHKGNWEKGLPYLSRGANMFLKEIADLELSEPKDAGKQADIGRMWQRRADVHEGMARVHVLLRAYQWYQQAVGDLGPFERKGIEENMNNIMKALPAEYRIGEIATEWKVCSGSLGPIYGGDFSSDGKKVVTAGADGSLRLWDAKTGKEKRRLDGHVGRAWTVAFAPDSRRVLSGGFDNTLRLWDLTTGREVRKFEGHKDYVRSVVFSRDGRWALSGGDDRTVRLWNVDTGKEEKEFKGHDHFVWCVALSRDGKLALSGSLDKTARLWDVETGLKKQLLKGHSDTVLAVAFSPDGRKALTGSTDKTLKLWDLANGSCLLTLAGHKGYVHSVAFSPDGRRILSAGADNSVRLWDAKTGEQIRVLEGHKDQVWHVAFSRDGRQALSTGQDATLRIWGGAR